MAGVPSFAFGAGFTAKTPQDAARARAVYEALAARGGAPTDVGSGLNRIGEALLARSMLDRATSAEQEGNANATRMFSGLQDGADRTELMAAMSDPWVQENPGMSAVTQALLQREMKKGETDWQTFDSGGDVYRWNANDPESQPSVFFDGPDAPLAPPEIEENYDPATGLPRKQQWNAATGTWDDFGGVAAPKDPLVNVAVNNGGADEEFYKAGAKARGEQFAAVETAGYQAQTKIGQINRLEQLLATAPQGMEGGWKQFVGEFGIASEGLDDIQAAQALVNKLVPEQRTPGSGPMSDADLALFKQSMPRIMNQPDGNALIIQTLKGIAVYEQKMGEIATRVLNKEITPAEGRAEMAAVENPLEMFREGDKSASDAGNVPDGVDPEDWAVMTPDQRKLWD